MLKSSSANEVRSGAYEKSDPSEQKMELIQVSNPCVRIIDGGSSSAAAETGGGGGGGGGGGDQLLPIANVGRIMKKILPSNAKISKEAKETMQECASEFISFVASEASDKCNKERRKTVNGDDICWAFGTLGFDSFVQPMKRYLNKYRDYESKRAAAAAATAAAEATLFRHAGSGGGDDDHNQDGSGDRHFKMDLAGPSDNNTTTLSFNVLGK
ncbi:Nuclear transcription factor Y subunit B-5 [Zostera marina]|uniref:Nuclear transcription factor Y subunit B-5 n=1 Tax=Zostera marina TaxID=29655 RepID=A0A0K9P4I0_ZOSMR|nr:Nuclear transcription factor Y subunit B-5 [Zostera marina]